MPRHKFTAEDSRKGGEAKAAKIRAERDAARQLADEQLARLATKALARLEELLDGEDPDQWPRAIREVLDRVMGRPVQRQEIGGPEGGEVVIRLAFDPDDP